MISKIIVFIFLLNAHCANSETHTINIQAPKEPDLIHEIVDEKWDQIQKGHWLVGFFDRETPESQQLDKDWEVYALKLKEQDIKVGRVFAPKNPGLYVRFLVTVFPKVFYIKNGVAHEVTKVSRKTLVTLIEDKNWSKLKAVNFLSNPFSVQMSLLSHLFVFAVNIYNYEHAIVQKYFSSPSATDVAFALTFIFVGTFLGLFLTCAFGLLQIFFMDAKHSKPPPEERETPDRDDESEKEVEAEVEESSEKSNPVRKRK